MTSFDEVWERDLASRVKTVSFAGDDETEFIRLLCNMAYIEGSTDGYIRGREDALTDYNKIIGRVLTPGTNTDGD